jgi:hypothetical protein
MNNHEHEYQPTIQGESRCVWCMEPDQEEEENDE